MTIIKARVTVTKTVAIEAWFGGSMKLGVTPGGGMPEGVLVGSIN